VLISPRYRTGEGVPRNYLTAGIGGIVIPSSLYELRSSFHHHYRRHSFMIGPHHHGPFQDVPGLSVRIRRPLKRRFHAQPNACPICGPRSGWPRHRGNGGCTCSSERGTRNSETIEQCADLFEAGAIVALKGLEGFTRCDATNVRPWRRLRERKSAPPNPCCHDGHPRSGQKSLCLTPDHEALLTSPSCPIVLMEWKPESTVVRKVASGQQVPGSDAPYTPLHHLLLHDVGHPGHDQRKPV